MKRTTKVITSIAVLSIFVVGLVIVLNQNEPVADHAVTADDIAITILSAERKPDNSVYVTAEITNSSRYGIKDNRLFVVGSSSEGEVHASGSNRVVVGGEARADDPPGDIPVRELKGSFDPIPSNDAVTIGFTVPSEKVLYEPLYVIFQSWKTIGNNTEETRAITVTVPLRLQD